MWQQLLEIALLGTEKKPLDATTLPPEIRDFITARHNSEPELKFLEAVALSYYYREAGKMPEKFTGEWDEAVIEEKLEIAPTPILNIFNKLETVDHHLKEDLLNRWLNLLVEKRFIISAELIIKLLNAGNMLSQQTKSNILKVIGNKGAWVLSYTNEFNYKQPVAQDHVWDEGSTGDRKSLLLSLRRSDPSGSIHLLRSTWEKESVVAKKSFLEIIRDTAVPFDLSFIEALYENEFKYRPKEKKTEKDCRRILVDILLRYTETKLYASTAAALSAYIKAKKKGIVGLVTGKEQITLTIPEEADSFWNVENMEQVYGFETKNYDIALYAHIHQSWLASFLEVLPVKFWRSHFEGGYRDLLSCFLDNDTFKVRIGGKDVPVFLQSLLGNVGYHQDSILAAHLFQRLTAQEVIPLLKYLSREDYEQYVTTNKYYIDYEVLQNGPFDHDRTWSLSFSRQVIMHVYEHVIHTNFALPFIGQVMARFINSDARNDLIQYNTKAKDHATFGTWNKNIFEPVHSALEIRTLIDSYKNSMP